VRSRRDAEEETWPKAARWPVRARFVTITVPACSAGWQRPRRLVRPRTSPFHGGNTGSNPVGDAKIPNDSRDCWSWSTRPISVQVAGRNLCEIFRTEKSQQAPPAVFRPLRQSFLRPLLLRLPIFLPSPLSLFPAGIFPRSSLFGIALSTGICTAPTSSPR
jgi:hypothetical protein